MKPDVIVIYHAGCWDGFCAAWLLWKCFPDAEFHAAHYGTEPPNVEGKKVFIVDFSYPRDVMKAIFSASNGAVVVLDRHKTSEEALDGVAEEWRLEVEEDDYHPPVPTVVFNMNKSGGRLTWEHVYGNRLLPDWMLATNKSGYSIGVSPWLVDYTEDRDLWKWELHMSREVNAYIRSFPLDFNEWDVFNSVRKSSTEFLYLADAGEAILRREAQIVDQHVRHAREIDMGGHKVLAVNATVLFSDIAGKLAEDRPFGACYFDRSDGKRQWSLRSRAGGVDVSEIAKAHGGGGHRNAAGFEEGD